MICIPFKRKKRAIRFVRKSRTRLAKFVGDDVIIDLDKVVTLNERSNGNFLVCWDDQELRKLRKRQGVRFRVRPGRKHMTKKIDEPTESMTPVAVKERKKRTVTPPDPS